MSLYVIFLLRDSHLVGRIHQMETIGQQPHLLELLNPEWKIMPVTAIQGILQMLNISTTKPHIQISTNSHLVGNSHTIFHLSTMIHKTVLHRGWFRVTRMNLSVGSLKHWHLYYMPTCIDGVSHKILKLTKWIIHKEHFFVYIFYLCVCVCPR